MKVSVELSNNDQKIQPFTLWREGAIYTPSHRSGFPKLPPQLIYSSLLAGSGVKLQGERFINPIFSRIREVYRSDLLTYSRFAHMPSTDKGYDNLRVPPGVWATEVPSTIDQPSSSFPVVGSFPEGLDLRVYAFW